MKAARAFLVFKAVEEFGQIVVYSPSSQDIEDERFELDFSLFLSSNAALDDILKAVKNVSEIADAVGEEVKTATLFHEEMYRKIFQQIHQKQSRQSRQYIKRINRHRLSQNRQANRLQTVPCVWISKTGCTDEPGE